MYVVQVNIQLFHQQLDSMLIIHLNVIPKHLEIYGPLAKETLIVRKVGGMPVVGLQEKHMLVPKFVDQKINGHLLLSQ